VTRATEKAPRSMADLAGKKLALIIGSGHSPMLMRLKRKYPKLGWAALETSARRIAGAVAGGKYDAVVINGMDFDPMRNVYPELAVAFNLPEKQQIVWALPKAVRRRYATDWRVLSKCASDGSIKRIYERYFGHLRQLDSSDILAFCSVVRRVCPNCGVIFRSANTDRDRLAATGRNWLSGIAVECVCHFADRGARLMMLTGETADRMG